MNDSIEKLQAVVTIDQRSGKIRIKMNQKKYFFLKTCSIEKNNSDNNDLMHTMDFDGCKSVIRFSFFDPKFSLYLCNP
jgi:hypothetical protein